MYVRGERGPSRSCHYTYTYTSHSLLGANPRSLVSRFLSMSAVRMAGSSALDSCPCSASRSSAEGR